ncbi:MAG TPA: trehalose-phosphatase [Terracidiphilus sp.]|nr:trehalose-phosphatase [Terracidiphilus sp.]
MTPESAEMLGAFFARFSRSESPRLLLDYDGTLAPFCVDRFEARPWAGVRELLHEIQRSQRARMTVISGRPAAEVARLLDLTPAPEIWGLHGAERLHANGSREMEQIPSETRSRLDELRRQLKRDNFGGLFEDKPNAVVMHWRGAAPVKAAEIEARTRALFEPAACSGGLTLLKFEAGLELRTGRDKGDAVRSILQEASGGKPDSAPAAFLGDDITDESAFCALKAWQGPHFTALVRGERRETAADVWLRPPGELLEFLQRWLEASAP